MADPVHDVLIVADDRVVDANGHVNNVAWVQWMQDVAIAHADATGCTAQVTALGATWVVREHHIEYLRPAYAGDRIRARTWVADFRRARSTRRYEFRRADDDTLLVRGATDWVYVGAADGRPRSIPPAVSDLFTCVPDS